MKKMLIIRIVIGFIVGVVMGNLITLMVNLAYGEGAILVPPHQVEAMGYGLALIFQTVLSGLLGVVCIGGISFYDIETWSLLQATIAHSLSMMISFIVVFSALQWVPFTLVNCLVIAALVLVTYALFG